MDSNISHLMHHHPFRYLYQPEGTVMFFICLFGGQAALDCLSLMLLAMTNVSELITLHRHHCLHLLCVLLQCMYLHQPVPLPKLPVYVPASASVPLPN